MGAFDNLSLVGNKEADQTLAGLANGAFTNVLNRVGVLTPDGTRQPAVNIPTNTGRPASTATLPVPKQTAWYKTTGGKVAIAVGALAAVLIVAHYAK